MVTRCMLAGNSWTITLVEKILLRFCFLYHLESCFQTWKFLFPLYHVRTVLNYGSYMKFVVIKCKARSCKLFIFLQCHRGDEGKMTHVSKAAV